MISDTIFDINYAERNVEIYIYIYDTNIYIYSTFQFLSWKQERKRLIAAGGVRLSRVVITRDSRPVFIFVNAIVLFNLVHTN